MKRTWRWSVCLVTVLLLSCSEVPPADRQSVLVQVNGVTAEAVRLSVTVTVRGERKPTKTVERSLSQFGLWLNPGTRGALAVHIDAFAEDDCLVGMADGLFQIQTDELATFPVMLTNTTKRCQVTVSIQGAGAVTAAPSGVRCTTEVVDCPLLVPVGSRVQLTSEPTPGSAFRGWSGPCSGASLCDFTVQRPTAVGALFWPTLKVNRQGLGAAGGFVRSQDQALLCGEQCTLAVPTDTRLTLWAGASATSCFTGWGGDCKGSQTCEITIRDPVVVNADFAICRLTAEGPLGTLLQDIWGSAANDVWAAGLNGLMWHWNGATWQRDQTAGVMRNLRRIWGSGPDDVWMVGESGTAIHWDGRWSAQNVGLGPEYLVGLFGSRGNDVWAAGERGILWRWRGGAWSRIESGTSSGLFSLWGTAPDDIWLGGTAGFLRHFDGMTWQPVPNQAPWSVLDIWGSERKDVWLVGGENEVLRWNGASLVPYKSSVARELNKVWGSGRDDVWAVGVSGTIIHYDGQAWTLFPSGVGDTLYGVWGSGPADVWFVGDRGTVLHYQP